MKTIRIFLVLITLVLIASCSPNDNSQEHDTSSLSQTGEKTCGDSVCDGPENQTNCPEDCVTTEVGAVRESSDAENYSSEETDNGFRYVSSSGTIETHANLAASGDFSGDYFEYSGFYSIELWFPMEGGKAVQQRNSITLTEFKALFQGESSCRPCDWEPEEQAYQPVNFDLEAVLNLDGVIENNKSTDEVVYQLIKVPQQSFSVSVSCPCPGSQADYTDSAAYQQLLGWFFQKLVNPIQLNALETNQVEEFTLNPLGSISIPEENLSYILVPDLNTP